MFLTLRWQLYSCLLILSYTTSYKLQLCNKFLSGTGTECTFGWKELHVLSSLELHANSKHETESDNLNYAGTPRPYNSASPSNFKLLNLLPLALTLTPFAAKSNAADAISQRPFVYSIDFTDPPSLLPRTRPGEEGVLQKFAESDVVILGEHPESGADHVLEANILSRLISKKKSKNMAIGLEAVERVPAFQTALDTYIQSELTKVPVEEADSSLSAALGDMTWLGSGSFEGYKPLLHLAREQGVRLVALGVPSMVLERVEGKGLEALTDEEREKFVPDPQGFLDSVDVNKNKGFKRYVDLVILGDLFRKSLTRSASTGKDKEGGGDVGPKMSVENFYSSRILGDEGLAAGVLEHVKNSRGGGGGGSKEKLLVVIASLDRVKFGQGLQERVKRLLTPAPKEKEGKEATPSATASVVSVLLNPTAYDSLSGTVQLQLCLAYGPSLKDQKPLADFLWYGPYAPPPMKLLTRLKNPISREGDRPEGESSVIGAFSSRRAQ